MAEHLPFNDEEFSGRLPLFPLPNVVLLPGGLLSLHVFEPRYRKMVIDALKEEKYIGMAVLKPGYEDDYDGTPPIFDRVCLGEVTREHKFPDGRWLITLRGMRRVDILEEEEGEEYRIAKVALAQDVKGTLDIELSRLRSLIAATAMRTPDSKLSNAQELHRLLSASEALVDNGLYFDLVAAVSALDLEDRRAILEATSLCERAHILLDGLTSVVIENQKPAREWTLCELSES